MSLDTRPVLYDGEREDGILAPLLKRLERIGVKVQNAIFYSIRKIERKIRGKPRMALIKEGPYAVTVKSDRRTIQCQL